MQLRKLGRTDIGISPILMGTWQAGGDMWTDIDDAETSRAIQTAIDEGITTIDTAAVYGNGHSERVVGKAIGARRSEVVLATKVFANELQHDQVIAACERSLENLGTDYIDLYQTHWFDAATPIDETMSALDTLVRQGKVRYVGCSNYPAWRLVQSLWASDRHQLVRYDSIQPHYNLVHRREFEQDLAEIVTEYNIGVIPYSPLAGGFLTGKYDRENVPNSARAQGVRQRYFNEAGWRTLDAVRLVAKQTDSSPAVVSLAWLLAQSFMTAPIIGANNVEQLQQSLDAVDLQLTPEQKDMLSEASAWRRDEG